MTLLIVGLCRALKSGSASDWLSYKTLCNKVNVMLQSAKAAYFQDVSSSLKISQANFESIFNPCPGVLSLHVKLKFQLRLMLSMIIFVN